MTDWNALTDLEQAAVIYSDMHKDAYGFRPRNGGVHCPVTLEDYAVAFDELGKMIAEENDREAVRSAAAIAKLEEELTDLQHDHGIARADALRWWFEAEGCEDAQDREHALWKRGIAVKEWAKYGCSPY
jgi:hypothetical protein